MGASTEQSPEDPSATPVPSAEPAPTAGPEPGTVSTSTQPPAPPDAPFFDGGDWVALAVGAVSIVVAVKAKRTADRAARAAEKSANEQKRANDLLVAHRSEDRYRRDAEQQAERERSAAEQLREARKIRADRDVHRTAQRVFIVNDSRGEVTDVELRHVVYPAQPSWPWSIDEYTHARRGQPSACPVLHPHGKHVFWVTFDEEGAYEREVEPRSHLPVTFRFTDPQQQRWERTDDGEPRRVPPEPAQE